MRKKILSLCLCLILIIGTSLSTFAAESEYSEHKPHPAAAHTCVYSSWQSLGTRTEPATSLLYCFVLVDIQYRYCLICNASQMREQKVNAQHSYVTTGNKSVCRVCGWTLTAVR